MSSFRGSPSIRPADIARSPRVQNAPFTSWESALTLEDRTAYAKLFTIADEEKKGFITGQEAVNFFAKSGVPSQILAEIWEAVDKENRGFLTPETFTMALKLISCAQHGCEPASPLLSTPVPLPQFEGVSIANTPLLASPRLSSPFQTNDEESHSAASGGISATAREKYSKMFLMANPVNGVLDAERARTIFMKSNLSVDQLAQIWNLADARRSGTLNQTEFVIAMHYIAGVMDSSISSLPATLPPAVYNSAAGRTTPTSPVTRQFSGERSLSPSFMQRFPTSSPSLQKQAISPQFTGPPLQSQASLSIASAFPAPAANNVRWDVTDQEKQKFDNFFDKIDSRGTGVVQGNDAVEFFQNSRLPETELAQIWDLADTQQRGKLSREEFAVAMHLIHKRLAGQPIPRQLPATLIPPSARQASQPIPTFANNSVAAFPSAAFSGSPAVKTHAAKSLIDDTDLLGDFDNNAQITTDTNQVNQLQNQISDTITSTNEVRKQKLSIEESLAQLQKQKQEYSAQLSQLQLAFNQENGDLQKLQETMNNEQPDLLRVRQETETAEANLNLLRNQNQELERKIQDGRVESEQLRRRVTEIQEETRLLKLEIQNLQTSSRKQDMMLDVNRRQVTAAEMDKSAVSRELNEVREERGLPPRDPNEKIGGDTQSIVSDHNTADETIVDNDPFQRAASPNSRPSTAQSLNQPSMPFSSAFQPRTEAVASPAMTMNSFDAAFEDLASPTLNTSLPKERPYSPLGQATAAPATNAFSDAAAKSDTNDTINTFSEAAQKPSTSFDDAFGDLDDSHDTAAQPQASNDTSVASAFDDSFLKTKGTNLALDLDEDSSDDEEVLSKVQARKTNDVPTGNLSGAAATSPKQESEQSKQPNFDDFDEVFGGKLDDAEIVPASGAKAFDNTFKSSFDDFDDAFDKPHSADQPATAAATDKGKSKFDAFDFSDFETQLGTSESTNGNVHDDLDSIFGSPAAGQIDTKVPAQSMSFEDAFGSFDAPPATSTNPPATAISAANDKVKSDDKPEIMQLIGMGFSRAQAVDALRRYDNDLIKATNFLLDN
ncbi:hypothetical protein Unana1_04386 [Umbelopsis nana]